MSTTFNTENSQSTYTVPSGAELLTVEIVGGQGAPGDDASEGAGGSGGAAGKLVGTVSVSGGDTFTVSVGETATGSGGASSPLNGGQSGGDGGSAGSGNAGGGGGAPSGVVRDSDGALLGVGDGGGGGGSGYPGGSGVGGVGGGGARGGLGGSGESAGGDATGTGAGGDGGDGGDDNINDERDGQAGGTTSHTDFSVESSGTSTSGPSVTITAIFPPARPLNLRTTDVRVVSAAAEIDLAWDDPDNVPETEPEVGYRVLTSTDGGQSYTTSADLAADTETATLTGLRTGEQYTIAVEAFTDDGLTARDYTTPIDIAAGETVTVASGSTYTFTKPLNNAGVVDNAGVVEPDDAP